MKDFRDESMEEGTLAVSLVKEMERREKMERKKMKMKMKSEGMNGECEVRVYICGLTLGLTTNVMQINPKCHVNEGD